MRYCNLLITTSSKFLPKYEYDQCISIFFMAGKTQCYWSFVQKLKLLPLDRISRSVVCSHGCAKCSSFWHIPAAKKTEDKLAGTTGGGSLDKVRALQSDTELVHVKNELLGWDLEFLIQRFCWSKDFAAKKQLNSPQPTHLVGGSSPFKRFWASRIFLRSS